MRSFVESIYSGEAAMAMMGARAVCGYDGPQSESQDDKGVLSQIGLFRGASRWN